MRKMLRGIVSVIFMAAAHASAQPAADINCEATSAVFCEASACGSDRSEKGDIPVHLELSAVSGTGTLCTYTYCRDFVLVPFPGDSLDDALQRLRGFTLSDSGGSKASDRDRPAIDYQLSISEDRQGFILGGLVDGRFVGWTGTCTPMP